MKFNSYFVEVEHRESNFTDNLLRGDKPLTVNFKKIGKNLFIAYFKTQVGLKFLERLEFKKRKKDLLVLYPVFAKYNKRKLTKISKILGKPEEREPEILLLNFSAIEKSFGIAELLDFFSIDRKEMSEFLIRMELDKKIKIIDFLNLTVISYDNFLKLRAELNSIFTSCFVNRNKTLKTSEIESRLKLPQSSIFFRYLLYSFREDFFFRIIKDKIIFRKIALTDKEKEVMEEVEGTLKKNRATIFEIEDILKFSGLLYKEVNDSLWYLIDSGKIVQLNKKYFIFTDELNKILNKLKKYKRNQGEMIDIIAFRELTLYSRKYIIPLFEYFDSQNITRRIDNQREILLGV